MAPMLSSPPPRYSGSSSSTASVHHSLADLLLLNTSSASGPASAGEDGAKTDETLRHAGIRLDARWDTLLADQWTLIDLTYQTLPTPPIRLDPPHNPPKTPHRHLVQSRTIPKRPANPQSLRGTHQRRLLHLLQIPPLRPNPPPQSLRTVHRLPPLPHQRAPDTPHNLIPIQHRPTHLRHLRQRPNRRILQLHPAHRLRHPRLPNQQLDRCTHGGAALGRYQGH
jgi:hypothetical protein